MDDLAALITKEQGKTLGDAKGDVFRGLEVVEFACGAGSRLMGETLESVGNGIDTYSYRQPLGVCAGIAPFNFPAMIPLWMYPLACVLGNTYVLKPSERVPLTSVMLMELAIQSGFPPGTVNLIHGAHDTVNFICDHPDIRAISFVGSNVAGEHIYKYPAPIRPRSSLPAPPPCPSAPPISLSLPQFSGWMGSQSIPCPHSLALRGSGKSCLLGAMKGARRPSSSAKPPALYGHAAWAPPQHGRCRGMRRARARAAIGGAEEGLGCA